MKTIFTDASTLENINVEADSHPKETWLQMKHHLALFPILRFSIKNPDLGFFFPRRAARCCIFVIQNTSVKRYITETQLLLPGVTDAFLSAYCFFHHIGGNKKSSVDPGS